MQVARHAGSGYKLSDYTQLTLESMSCNHSDEDEMLTSTFSAGFTGASVLNG